MTQPVRKPMRFTAGKSFFRGMVPSLNDGREILIGGGDAGNVVSAKEVAVPLPAREAEQDGTSPSPSPSTWLPFPAMAGCHQPQRAHLRREHKGIAEGLAFQLQQLLAHSCLVSGSCGGWRLQGSECPNLKTAAASTSVAVPCSVSAVHP